MDADFTDFVSANHHRLLRRAYLLTSSFSSAEDLVQATFTKTYLKWHRVSRAENVVAYVDTMLLRTFLSDRRRRSSQELPTATSAGQPGFGTSLDDHSQSATERMAILAAVGQLSDKERAVVVLRFYDDFSVAQTAQTLGVSEATVKSRSHRALRRLRNFLEPPMRAKQQISPAELAPSLAITSTSWEDYR